MGAITSTPETLPHGTNPDRATTLDLASLVDERHSDADARHGELAARGARHGPFRGTRRGQGLELDELRPYAAGDDVRHVDWKTSARRAALHTRLYREEKEHVVTIALDLRASMYTGSTTLRAVDAGRLAARLLWRASAGGSRTGIATLHDTGVSLSRATAGERGALIGCRLIAETFAHVRHGIEHTPRATPAPPSLQTPSLQTLFEKLLASGRMAGSTIVLTGLDAPLDAPLDAARDAPSDTPRDTLPGTADASFDAALIRLATARPVAVVHIEDPIERTALPPGRYRYAGTRGIGTAAIDRSARRRLGAALAQRRARLEARFAATGASLLSNADGPDRVMDALRAERFLS